MMLIPAWSLAFPLFGKRETVAAADIDLENQLRKIIGRFPPTAWDRAAETIALAPYSNVPASVLKPSIDPFRLPLPLTVADVLSGKLTAEHLERQIPDSPRSMIATREAYPELLGVAKEMGRINRLPVYQQQNLENFTSDVGDLLAKRHGVREPEIFQVTNDIVGRSFLHKLIKAEQVHPIVDKLDLLRRLGWIYVEPGKSRRAIYACVDKYAPHKSALMGIHANFVSHAHLSDNVNAIINGTDKVKGTLDTAVFYTISNWKIINASFGQKFIYNVVKEIQESRPSTKNFYTLSPMDGFRKWVEKLDAKTWESCGAAEIIDMPWDTFKKSAIACKTGKEIEQHDLRDQLELLATLYMNGGRASGRGFRAFEGVAHFHYSNGARLERVNWGANTASYGEEQSWGMMVNFRYSPNNPKLTLNEFLALNKHAYADGQPALSDSLQEILAQAQFAPSGARSTPPEPPRLRLVQ